MQPRLLTNSKVKWFGKITHVPYHGDEGMTNRLFYASGTKIYGVVYYYYSYAINISLLDIYSRFKRSKEAFKWSRRYHGTKYTFDILPAFGTGRFKASRVMQFTTDFPGIFIFNLRDDIQRLRGNLFPHLAYFIVFGIYDCTWPVVSRCWASTNSCRLILNRTVHT